MVRFTPIAGAGCVVMVFSVFEYFRSWVTYYSGATRPFGNLFCTVCPVTM